MAAAQDPIDEGGMYRLLHEHVCGNGAGNGPTAIMAPAVRSAAGFDAKRTIDAVSLGMWPSRGMLLDGFEIKISRSDWLRELKNPAKAEEFARLVDRLWLVVSEETIVKDEELPDGWGLLVRVNGALKQKVKAERLHEGKGLPPGFGRSFLVPLLRAANCVPPDVRAELKAEAESSAKFALREAENLQARVDAFEKAAGIKITDWESDPAKAAERGAAFAAALDGEEQVRRLQSSARYIANSAKCLAKDAEKIAGPEDKDT